MTGGAGSASQKDDAAGRPDDPDATAPIAGVSRATAPAPRSTSSTAGAEKARPTTTTAGAEKARRKAPTAPVPRPGSPTAPGNPDGAGVDRDDPPAGGGGAAAKRALRRATRERRRYERAEARRFTKRSRRRRLAWLVAGASVAGLVLLVLLVAYSPLLSVRQIVVEGASRLDAATVTAALADEQGKPLALVDYGAIERELAGFPLIATYSVEARPPDTLAVRLVERRPVAQVQTPTEFDLIDAAGVTVQSSPQRIPGFPLLDLSGTQIGSPGFEAAAAVLQSLPDDLLAQVESVSGSTPDSVTMVFGGAGQRVVWGSAEDSALKAVILQRLIATQNPAPPVEYDVSSPQSPVVR